MCCKQYVENECVMKIVGLPTTIYIKSCLTINNKGHLFMKWSSIFSATKPVCRVQEKLQDCTFLNKQAIKINKALQGAFVFYGLIAGLFWN